MRIRQNLLALASAGFVFPLFGANAAAQTEIPMQRCDRLPVVILQVDREDKRFLVDTAATSFLNANSFTGRRTKEVRIQSWNETTALNAGDVSIGTLALGSHLIQNIRLPAIDLTAISKACGGQLDGILGVDLLERLGVTIDLERSVARLDVGPDEFELSLIVDVEKTIGSCAEAFNSADLEKLVACFDPEFVLSSPGGELHGKDQAANYFRQYFGTSPQARLQMRMSSQRGIGELVWGLYDYTIQTGSTHTEGRGMILCRKSGDRWYIVSMQESPFSAAGVGKP